jgi:hypothetical protein
MIGDASGHGGRDEAPATPGVAAGGLQSPLPQPSVRAAQVVERLVERGLVSESPHGL